MTSHEVVVSIHESTHILGKSAKTPLLHRESTNSSLQGFTHSNTAREGEPLAFRGESYGIKEVVPGVLPALE